MDQFKTSHVGQKNNNDVKKNKKKQRKIKPDRAYKRKNMTAIYLNVLSVVHMLNINMHTKQEKIFDSGVRKKNKLKTCN